MLVNDYSVLPLADGRCGDKWKSIRAEDLAAYLAGDGSHRSETLRAVVESGNASNLFHRLRALSEDTSVDTIWLQSNAELPVVVTRGLGAESNGSEIVGIVTAFDLL